ncbi:MAG: hypothetical protein AAB359_00265 [Elusimicrobiota bacterium]
MRTRKRPGQTLLEVTMATLIAAITTMAVFSVILSTYVSDARADKRDAASMALRRAQDTLKSYVSAEPANATYVPSSTSGIGRWPADSSGSWALAGSVSGTTHDISSLLNNGEYPALNPGGVKCIQGSAVCYFVYVVTDSGCGFGSTTANACKNVVFYLNYPD